MAITRIEDREGNEINVNKDGSLNTRTTAGTVKDSWEGLANEVRQFSEPMQTVAIVNDGNADLFFTVGKITIKVKAEEGWEDNFDPFTEISIQAAGPYRAAVKG